MANTTLTPTVAAAVFSGVAPGNFPSSAFLLVSEFAALSNDVMSGSTYPRAPSLNDQVVAYGAISAGSLPFSAQTRIVQISSTGTAAIKVGGLKPLAVAGLSSRLTAGTNLFFAVHPGDSVAAIVST